MNLRPKFRLLKDAPQTMPGLYRMLYNRRPISGVRVPVFEER